MKKKLNRRFNTSGKVYKEAHCYTCGKPFDADTAPNSRSNICLPCFKGLEKKEFKSHEDRLFKFSGKVYKKTPRKNKKSDLPVGVHCHQNKFGSTIYIAQYSGFKAAFSSKSLGHEEARKKAIKVRKKMVKLRDPLAIEDYLTELKKERKMKSVKTDESLPEGIGYQKETSKSSATYSASRRINGEHFITHFSISQFGKKKALDLAIDTYKKMQKITNPFKVRFFIKNEVPKIKDQHRPSNNEAGLPQGVSFKPNKNLYSATKTLEGKRVYISYTVKCYGKEKARELAIEARNEMKFCTSLKELRSVVKGLNKKRRDLPDGVSFNKVYSYYSVSHKIEGKVFNCIFPTKSLGEDLAKDMACQAITKLVKMNYDQAVDFTKNKVPEWKNQVKEGLV